MQNNNTVVVEKILNIDKLPSDAILIVYSDHYKHNSGHNLYFTTNKGEVISFQGIGKPSFWSWHESENDRGIISVTSITSHYGAFASFDYLKRKCKAYRLASGNLKKYNNGEGVFNVKHDNVNYDMIHRSNKDEIDWITILEDQKIEAAKFFDLNDIPRKVAYC